MKQHGWHTTIHGFLDAAAFYARQAKHKELRAASEAMLLYRPRSDVLRVRGLGAQGRLIEETVDAQTGQEQADMWRIAIQSQIMWRESVAYLLCALLSKEE